MSCNLMAENHRALFELFADTSERLKVMRNGYLLSVQTTDKSYPRLTLCYRQKDETNKEEMWSSLNNAIVLGDVAPYLIFKDDEIGANLAEWLKLNGFKKVEMWSAMCILPQNLTHLSTNKIELIEVFSHEQLNKWLKLVRANLFSTNGINEDVFINTLGRTGITCWLGFLNGEAVATAMSFVHNNIAGLYMVTTAEEYRNRGFGKELITKVLHAEFAKGGVAGVLQSTRMGEAMYRNIGFESNGQFTIYWKVGKQYI